MFFIEKKCFVLFFSLGVTILEVACDLDLPSHGDSWQMLRHGVLPEDLMTRKLLYFLNKRKVFLRNFFLFLDLSVDLRTIIYLMMLPDYLKRPTAANLLNYKTIKHLTKHRQLFCGYRKIVCKILRV